MEFAIIVLVFNNVRRIFGQSVVYGSADVAILAVNFLLVPVYTRILTPSDYGVLALLLLLEALLRPTSQCGLEDAFLRLYYDYAEPHDRRTLVGTITLAVLGTNVGVLLLLLSTAHLISSWLLGSPTYVTVVTLLALKIFVTAFFFIPLSLLRIQNKPKTFAAWSFGRSFGTVIARLVLVVGLRLGVRGIMLADLIVSLVTAMGLSRVVRPLFAWRFSPTMARDAFRYGLPQVPFAVLHQTMAMSDRFFLQRFLVLSDVGIYSIGSSIATLLKFCTVPFSRAWNPFSFDSMGRPDAPWRAERPDPAGKMESRLVRRHANDVVHVAFL